MEQLKGLFRDNPGQARVYLEVLEDGIKHKVETPYYVQADEELKGKIEKLAGPNTVSLDNY